MGKGWRPDGPAQYRHDPATERSDGVLVVSCAACSAIPNPDHSWYLTTTAPTPAAAELDDTAYADIGRRAPRLQLDHGR